MPSTGIVACGSSSTPDKRSYLTNDERTRVAQKRPIEQIVDLRIYRLCILFALRRTQGVQQIDEGVPIFSVAQQTLRHIKHGCLNLMRH
jgi:hypothetical protein